MTICVDFDGTCVTHEFPKIGRDIGAVPVLKELIANEHKLILFTMRSDIEDPQSKDESIHCQGGTYLTDAIEWFRDNDIPLYGIQSNPTQHSWTTSPKAYGQLYIDDAALGCPLIYNSNERPYVDWNRVRDMLIDMDLIKVEQHIYDMSIDYGKIGSDLLKKEMVKQEQSNQETHNQTEETNLVGVYRELSSSDIRIGLECEIFNFDEEWEQLILNEDQADYLKHNSEVLKGFRVKSSIIENKTS